MKHKYSELFDALRVEHHLELDDKMASIVASETRDAPGFAKGREFAAEIARAHGVPGIHALYLALRQHKPPLDEDERVSMLEFKKQLAGRSLEFRTGAELFCELSGVLFR